MKSSGFKDVCEVMQYILLGLQDYYYIDIIYRIMPIFGTGTIKIEANRKDNTKETFEFPYDDLNAECLRQYIKKLVDEAAKIVYNQLMEYVKNKIASKIIYDTIKIDYGKNGRIVIRAKGKINEYLIEYTFYEYEEYVIENYLMNMERIIIDFKSNQDYLNIQVI